MINDLYKIVFRDKEESHLELIENKFKFLIEKINLNKYILSTYICGL